jgi:hypothetical protein
LYERHGPAAGSGGIDGCRSRDAVSPTSLVDGDFAGGGMLFSRARGCDGAGGGIDFPLFSAPFVSSGSFPFDARSAI